MCTFIHKRNLGNAYSYQSIRTLSEDVLIDYCQRLYYNPLLIKWFVQAVGKGARPQDVLAHKDFDRAIGFCLANVYGGLSHSSKEIVSTLLAARRNLSQAQIREITAIDRISFEEAMLELRQSNVVEMPNGHDGSGAYQIGALVLEYLSRNHPPADEVVVTTRKLLKNWRVEQDESARRKNTYRYSKRYVHVETEDQRISGPYLRDALRAIQNQDISTADACVSHAEELTPDWSEVHRVKARLLELKGHPIYDIESAYENSTNYGDNDISRRHYAVYLMSIHEHERALEQIERALSHEGGLELVLKSLKGVILARLGRVVDALEEFEYVWTRRESNHSQFDRQIQGTQYADALRRHVEQLTLQGKLDEAGQALSKGIEVTAQTAEQCGWDGKLAEAGVRLLSIGISGTVPLPEARPCLASVSKQWDSSGTFVRECISYKTRAEFQRNEALARSMPKASRYEQSYRDGGQRSRGRIAWLTQQYGFIESEPHGRVHMNSTSLTRPSEWSTLESGQAVVFDVVIQEKGPHAVRLEREMV